MEPTAMEMGALDAANGIKLSENPYDPASEEAEEWEEGWHYFNDSDEDGEPRVDA